MNQEKNIETKAESQTRQGIKDAFAESYQSFIRMEQIRIVALITSSANRRRQGGGFNIFLIQNLGKGPPGRTRSPVTAYCLIPDNQPAARTGSKTLVNNEFQQFNTNTNFKFLQTFKFFIMKKQILFLVLFMLALIAGTSTAFGQTAVNWSTATTLSCTNDALHPIAGVKYTYHADVTDASTTAGSGRWRFWATTDPTFITTTAGVPTFNTGTALTVGANQLTFASTDYNIAIGTAGDNTDGTIELTWSSTILKNTVYKTTPTFVVAYYVNNAGCTDNIKVWELDPLNGFTVDIIAMDGTTPATSKDAYGVTPTTCVDKVETATYATGTMHYDYGDNYLYFEFIAANFTNYWVPTFQILAAGLGTSQVITSYEYTYATPVSWTAATSWSPLASGTTQLQIDPTVTDITKGVSIFVRVLIDHNQYENLPGQTLTMELDGQNADGTWDVLNTDCKLPFPLLADQNDKATSTITPRPTIPEAAPSTISTIPTNIQIIPGDNK